MRSGSQSNLYAEIPFISEGDFGYDLETPSSDWYTETMSRSEDVAPERIRCNAAKYKSARLLHGRSPLGLATPILADNLAVVARPARIADERLVRCAVPAAVGSWTTDPPCAIESAARSQSSQRKRNIETPLARSLLKDFQRKFYRRRVVELALRNGLARRVDTTVRRKPVPSA